MSFSCVRILPSLSSALEFRTDLSSDPVNSPLLSFYCCLLCFSDQSIDVFTLIPSTRLFHFSIQPSIFLSEHVCYSGGLSAGHLSLNGLSFIVLQVSTVIDSFTSFLLFPSVVSAVALKTEYTIYSISQIESAYSFPLRLRICS